MESELISLTEPALRYLRSQFRIDMRTFLKTLYTGGPKTNNSLGKGEMQLLRELIYYKLISIKKQEKNFNSSLIGDWKPFSIIEYSLNEDGMALVKTLFRTD